MFAKNSAKTLNVKFAFKGVSVVTSCVAQTALVKERKALDPLTTSW